MLRGKGSSFGGHFLEISWKEKAVYGLLVLFFFASFSVNVLNFVNSLVKSALAVEENRRGSREIRYFRC